MKLFLQNSNVYDQDTSTSQTDRRTDRRTTCYGNTALCVASRGKNSGPGKVRSQFKILLLTVKIVYIQFHKKTVNHISIVKFFCAFSSILLKGTYLFHLCCD